MVAMRVNQLESHRACGYLLGTEKRMEIIFLGTGAAEGAPAAYCRCATCRGVRERGGVELRTRSSLRIGQHHQIDISPDHYGQTIAAGTDMYDVEHILITHTHEDHFTLPALTDKQMTRKTNGKLLSVYLSEPARAFVDGIIERMSYSEKDLRWIHEHLAFVGLEYFHEYTIGGFTVQTIKGNHTARGVNEYSINYLVGMPGGKKLLYACDTGYYQDEAWEYLSGKRLDTLVLECTFAGRTDRGEFPESHLDLASWFKTLERMSRIGFIDDRTAVYATHFNPHQGLSHFEIQDRLQQSTWRATAAYDRLRVEV
jgi:phosphoribosyl 1,2-cyclic phosphate phosphodiesterase